MGLLVTAIDLLTVSLAQGTPPDSEIRVLLETIDQVFNVAIFGIVGFQTGRATGRTTAAAEAGVVASLLPGLAAAAYSLIQPAEPGLETPLVSRIVASLAINIVFGGLSALIAGWLANRQRRQAG
jgi:hypothetical protein